MVRHFLSITDFSSEELTAILDRADELAERRRERRMPGSLEGKRVALWFWGNGFRNRMAFEIGARAMGADVSFVPGELGVQEPLEDVGRYLGNWFDMLVVRCRNHEDLVRVAGDAGVPVINARTTFNHPCEVMGDLQYIRRIRGTLDGLRVVFVGETTNLCMSWFEAAVRFPIHVVQVGPAGFLAPRETVGAMNRGAVGSIATTERLDAIDGSTDVLYTDCWPKDRSAGNILETFAPYRVTEGVLSRMKRDGFFLPCPPVTRGEEVTAAAMESVRCRVYEAKECLLHAQNAIMEFLAAAG